MVFYVASMPVLKHFMLADTGRRTSNAVRFACNPVQIDAVDAHKICSSAIWCCVLLRVVAQVWRKRNEKQTTTKSETNCAVKNRKSLIVTFVHRSLIENLIYIALCTWTITHNMHFDFRCREAWRAWECDCASPHCQSFSSVTISGRIFTCCLRANYFYFHFWSGSSASRAFCGFGFNAIDFEIQIHITLVAFRLLFYFIFFYCI